MPASRLKYLTAIIPLGFALFAVVSAQHSPTEDHATSTTVDVQAESGDPVEVEVNGQALPVEPNTTTTFEESGVTTTVSDTSGVATQGSATTITSDNGNVSITVTSSSNDSDQDSSVRYRSRERSSYSSSQSSSVSQSGEGTVTAE